MYIKKALVIAVLSIVGIGLFNLYVNNSDGANKYSSPNTNPTHSSADQIPSDHTQRQSETTEYVIVQSGQYYEITKCGHLYYCCFYNKTGNQIKAVGPLTRLPEVVLVDATLLRFTYQAGTGIGTQWGFYYDFNSEKLSEVFQSIADQQEGKVAYFLKNMVVVQDIFEKQNYYKEFSEFMRPLSKVAEPFVNAQFLDNNDDIEISYLSGNDYQETTETLPL